MFATLLGLLVFSGKIHIPNFGCQVIAVRLWIWPVTVIFGTEVSGRRKIVLKKGEIKYLAGPP